MGLDLSNKVCVGVGANRQEGQGLQCQLSCQLIHEGTCVAFPQESSRYDFEMAPSKYSSYRGSGGAFINLSK